MVTGHGLKTVEALAGTVGPTATIAPTLDSFAEAMAADHRPTHPEEHPDDQGPQSPRSCAR